jgi:5-methylcytosine-specific restriction enzyme A
MPIEGRRARQSLGAPPPVLGSRITEMRIEAAVIASEIGLGAANAPGPPRACRSGCPHFMPCPVHGPKAWANRRPISRQRRGYDAEHERLRRQVLREEPLCRACRIRATSVADHIVGLARGGKAVRSNYQGLCTDCSKTKSAREGASGWATLALGLQAAAKRDGWASPVSRQARDFLPLPPLRGRR